MVIPFDHLGVLIRRVSRHRETLLSIGNPHGCNIMACNTPRGRTYLGKETGLSGHMGGLIRARSASCASQQRARGSVDLCAGAHFRDFWEAVERARAGDLTKPNIGT